MKRDMELVRQLMTDFEKMPISGYTNGEYDVYGKGGEDFLSKLEHIRLLLEARLVDGEININQRMPRMSIFNIRRVTWAGHDFLDATRNPGVWSKTTERAKKAGAWTFDLIVEMAKEEVRRRLLSVTAE